MEDLFDQGGVNFNSKPRTNWRFPYVALRKLIGQSIIRSASRGLPQVLRPDSTHYFLLVILTFHNVLFQHASGFLSIQFLNLIYLAKGIGLR